MCIGRSVQHIPQPIPPCIRRHTRTVQRRGRLLAPLLVVVAPRNGCPPRRALARLLRLLWLLLLRAPARGDGGREREGQEGVVLLLRAGGGGCGRRRRCWLRGGSGVERGERANCVIAAALPPFVRFTRSGCLICLCVCVCAFGCARV